VAAGILSRKREGNRVYYKANDDSPLLSDLQGLLAKTAGLVDVLRESLRGMVRGIELAFVYGSLARGGERPGSDVDLLIVGRAPLTELSPRLRRAEARLGREVSVTTFAPEEFSAKARAGNHFLRAVLKREKLFVVGDQRVLEDTLRSRAR
jgi:predicted nucleotidyltransferase